MASLTAIEKKPLAAQAPAVSRPWLAAATLGQREWVRFIRQPNRVFGAIGQPVIFWLLFGAGLGPSFRIAGQDGARLSYGEYFFPGSLILILLFTAIFATISVIEDRREGFLQSVLVAPIPRWSMVLGKVAGGSLIALVEGLIFLALGLTIGLHFSVGSLLAIVVLLALVALALTSLGFVIAWNMDSTQGFHAVMSVFLMPMWLLSGAFFPPAPLSQTTSWMEWSLALVIALNPLTYGVAGLRRLLYLDGASAPLPEGLPELSTCWFMTLGFAVVMFVLASLTARRRTTGDLL
ncbi:MAG TPA: ABC transporter permease [Pirellulales bacterium]|jgi:ABC-2 type transport system permease protein|nr:ABC transporter permease [Pirellulales bacterium]